MSRESRSTDCHFSTGARPSVTACWSVAAADGMVDDGTPTQMQEETHHIKPAVAGKKDIETSETLRLSR